MIVSTKGRYALRVMIRLAQEDREEYVPLKEIAEEEEISQKYLEAIMTTLSKAGLVDAAHGKGGGYRLNRKPSEYTVGDVLKLTEGSLAAASCTSQTTGCERAGICRSRQVWERLDSIIDGFLESVTLESLIKEQE